MRKPTTSERAAPGNPAHRARSLFLFLLILVTAAGGVHWILQRTPAFDQAGLPPLPDLLQKVRVTEQRYRVLGYKRDEFGNGWGAAPIDGPDAGCTTRDAALRLQSQDYSATQCRPTAGVLFDPYTQTTIALAPSASKTVVAPAPLEVDHVIPLAAAWDLGAHEWDPALRRRFANDPLNLVVTSRVANQEKSDSLPAEWLPPHPAARCWYVRRLAAVARAYDLPLPAADITTIKRQCWTLKLQLANIGRDK